MPGEPLERGAVEMFDSICSNSSGMRPTRMAGPSAGERRFRSFRLSCGCYGSGLGSSTAGVDMPLASASRPARSATDFVVEFRMIASDRTNRAQLNIKQVTASSGWS
jgi:hypothetical protein